SRDRADSMKLVLWGLGLAAWVILALGIGMFATGWQLADQRFRAEESGPSHLPAQSDYVRRLYGQPLDNRLETIERAARILDLAGQRQKAHLLSRFFGYCNVQRLLGQEDACTRETVRSAVAKAEGLAPDTAWPADSELTSRLEHVLSFSWASKQQMQNQLRSEQGGQDGRYAGPGILRVDGQHQDDFVLLAVHNRGPWEIAGFGATLKLSGDRPIALQCDRNPFPFFWPHAFTTRTEEIRVCKQPENIATEALVAAVQQARRKGPPDVQLEEFELKNPYVRITDDADGGTSRFTLYPVHFPIEAAFSPRSTFDLLRELKKTSCESTDTCPSWGQAASLAFYDFFGRHILLLPFLVGLLMGVGMGGGFVASFRLAGMCPSGRDA
ncbi:MAG: hypothetical protein ACREFT_02125, partial [Acetobacteraceae bacterium]